MAPSKTQKRALHAVYVQDETAALRLANEELQRQNAELKSLVKIFIKMLRSPTPRRQR